MSIDDFEQLKCKVTDLCVLIHTEQVNEEQADLQETLADLLSLSVEDMIEYAKLIVTAMFKKQTVVENTSGYNGFQKALQKLEAEVRNHITVRSK